MRTNKWALGLRLLAFAVSDARRNPTPAALGTHHFNTFWPGTISFPTCLASLSSPDPDLVNPWGIAFSGGSPIWVSDNHTGLATIYNGGGVKQGLIVSIPAPGGGQGAPTGQVFNGGSGFHGDLFIFSTEDGTIAGWSGALGTTAELGADNSGAGSIYKGLALASNGANTYLYATDFHNGNVDVFDTTFTKVTLGGYFTDPNLPAGFAPFGIQASGGKFYVTYAMQDAQKVRRRALPGMRLRGRLRHRWQLCPATGFRGRVEFPLGHGVGAGQFRASSADDLLVGNFGDGTINVFDPATGAFLARSMALTGMPLVNEVSGVLRLEMAPMAPYEHPVLHCRHPRPVATRGPRSVRRALRLPNPGTSPCSAAVLSACLATACAGGSAVLVTAHNGLRADCQAGALYHNSPELLALSRSIKLRLLFILDWAQMQRWQPVERRDYVNLLTGRFIEFIDGGILCRRSG